MEQDAITELEGLTWEPMIGKISGFTCKVAGARLGLRDALQNRCKGRGLDQHLGGFHTDLELAKAAHAAAVVARKAALATPQEPKGRTTRRRRHECRGILPASRQGLHRSHAAPSEADGRAPGQAVYLKLGG
ncbi:hypothetical protein SSTU70S_04918 [Stutzerimonas stutzeri]